MTQIDLLQRFASSGAASLATRSGFHIYLWPYDGSSATMSSAGYDYYRNLGFNFTRDHYDISGTGPFIEANLKTGAANSVKFWAARAEWSYIDLWWIDNESSYYAGTAADAANSLAGAQNGVNWSKEEWANWRATTMYVGVYGNNVGIQKPNIVYPFNFTKALFETYKNDNDVCGIAVANTWDFMGPELYQSKMDEFCQAADWLANEKTRMGVTTRKLIPLISRGLTSSYEYMYARIAYLYSRPEFDGVILWGTDAPTAAPTYYDDRDWMTAAKDFLGDYGIAPGTPF